MLSTGKVKPRAVTARKTGSDAEYANDVKQLFSMNYIDLVTNLNL